MPGNAIIRLLFRLRDDDRGQDLAEYAMLLVLIALVAVASSFALGDELREQFFRAAQVILRREL